VSRYHKGKTNLDFTEARDSEWQWHQLGHMQENFTTQILIVKVFPAKLLPSEVDISSIRSFFGSQFVDFTLFPAVM